MAKLSRGLARRSDLGHAAANSIYERLGAETVNRLVAAFYARVDRDPVLRPLYGKTLTCAIHGLTAFLTTWLGGPQCYDLPGSRLRRRHLPFAIDARARDTWLANMREAVRDIGTPAAEAELLLAHLELAADALVNVGQMPAPVPLSDTTGRYDAQLTKLWNRLTQTEQVFDAVSNGDLALLRSLLPLRLVPHVLLMSHTLVDWLDPTGRADRRFGRRPKQVKPLQVIEFLLDHCDLDCDPDATDDLGRFRQHQAMIQAFIGVARFRLSNWPYSAKLRAATRDRFIVDAERDRSLAQLLGLRGQTLLHEAAMAGAAELTAALIQAGADPNARETGGHPPLYRATKGEVARLLLKAGAAVDAVSGPTRGTPLHQAARRGHVSVAQALLDHHADIDARDAQGQTPLRRAVNCRQVEMVKLLVQQDADRDAADRRGITPLGAARTEEIKRLLLNR